MEIEQLVTKINLKKLQDNFLLSKWCNNTSLANEVINSMTMEKFVVNANDIVSGHFKSLKKGEINHTKAKTICKQFEQFAIMTECYDTQFQDYLTIDNL